MTSSTHISVLIPLLVGLITILGTIIIQALMLGFVMMELRRDLLRHTIGIRYWRDVVFVAGATLLAIASHLVEIGLWAISLRSCGAFSDWSLAFYYAAVNFTTLGDSAIAVAARWKLLAALAAGDGMLMFGVTTAMLFAVIQRLVRMRFGEISNLIEEADRLKRRS